MSVRVVVANVCGGVGLFMTALGLLAVSACAAPRDCRDWHVPLCNSPGCQEPDGVCKSDCGGDPCDPGNADCACRTKYYQAMGTNCLCTLPEQGT